MRLADLVRRFNVSLCLDAAVRCVESIIYSFGMVAFPCYKVRHTDSSAKTGVRMLRRMKPNGSTLRLVLFLARIVYGRGHVDDRSCINSRWPYLSPPAIDPQRVLRSGKALDCAEIVGLMSNSATTGIDIAHTKVRLSPTGSAPDVSPSHLCSRHDRLCGYKYTLLVSTFVSRPSALALC